MKAFRKIVGVVLLAAVLAIPLPATDTHAIRSEGYDCLSAVTQALTLTAQICEDASRNQACYGHMSLEAQPQAGVTNFVFQQAGDIVDVANVKSLSLSAMDVDNGLWGVALMRLRANLSAVTPSKNVTLLLFGESAVQNAAENVAITELTVKTNGSAARVRRSPINGDQLVALDNGNTVTATGRLADNSWIRVQLEDGQTGWISSTLVDGDIESLDVVEFNAPYYGPMQAFYFESRTMSAEKFCSEATDGMLIQTPEGNAQVTFLINKVNIELGSTIYLTAEYGGDMLIAALEGRVKVTAEGFTSMAEAGAYLTVPMGPDGTPSGPPTLPKAYADGSADSLPVTGLDRAIEVAAPMARDKLQELRDRILGGGDLDVTTS